MPAFKDLTNQRFGKLVAISVEDKIEGRYRWKVQCDCGRKALVRGSDLTFGHITSCGCARSENNVSYWTGKKPTNTLPQGTAALNKLYGNYKTSARDRGYTFDLDVNVFHQLTSDTCYYCGREPSQVMGDYGTLNGSYVFNGIDRIDNTQGYIEGNVVTACKVCNRAKQAMTHAEFMEWIVDLIQHNS